MNCMVGGGLRSRLLPWSLDPKVWEWRVGSEAIRVYLRASRLWLLSVILLTVGLVTMLVFGRNMSALPWWVFAFGMALGLAGSCCNLASALQRARVVTLVNNRYSVRGASRASLTTKHLMDPALFDRWLTDTGAPLSPSPPV